MRTLVAALAVVSLLVWACTCHYDDLPARSGDW